jgi:large subunit ribosomal protein L15
LFRITPAVYLIILIIVMLKKLRIISFMFATMAERKIPPVPSSLPFTINNLWDNPGAIKIQKRWGRGGTRGNACGRGQRGQGARSGAGVPPKFEGGQTPLTRRLPKWGAKPRY